MLRVVDGLLVLGDRPDELWLHFHSGLHPVSPMILVLDAWCRTCSPRRLQGVTVRQAFSTISPWSGIYAAVSERDGFPRFGPTCTGHAGMHTNSVECGVAAASGTHAACSSRGGVLSPPTTWICQHSQSAAFPFWVASREPMILVLDAWCRTCSPRRLQLRTARHFNRW